jgi:hypothetical protein
MSVSTKRRKWKSRNSGYDCTELHGVTSQETSSTMKMKAISSCETFVPISQTTLRHYLGARDLNMSDYCSEASILPVYYILNCLFMAML